MGHEEQEVRPLVSNPVSKVLRRDVKLLGTVRQVVQVKVKEACQVPSADPTKTLKVIFTQVGFSEKESTPGQEGTTQQPTRTMLAEVSERMGAGVVKTPG